MKRWFLLISLAVLVADQWSKHWIEQSLPLHQSIEAIPGFLDLTHVRNTGVAFGLFAAHGAAGGTWLLTALGLGALAFVGFYFWSIPAEEKLLLTALALVLGGAVGNLVDRIATGAVTDFVDFYVGDWHWHTFNVADSAITVGITLMILSTFLHKSEEPATQTAAETTPETTSEP